MRVDSEWSEWQSEWASQWVSQYGSVDFAEHFSIKNIITTTSVHLTSSTITYDIILSSIHMYTVISLQVPITLLYMPAMSRPRPIYIYIYLDWLRVAIVYITPTYLRYLHYKIDKLLRCWLIKTECKRAQQRQDVKILLKYWLSRFAFRRLSS